MMAFASDYVVSIIHNNKPLREFSENGNRVCRVPFGAEYKIRLKNKNRGRALVSVTIDGMDVQTGGSKFLLRPGETFDLERFVDSLSEGKKFKFVEANNLQVQDPTSGDNGKIVVRFEGELIPLITSAWTATGSLDGILRGIPKSCFINTTNETYSCNANSSPAQPDAGATVEGGHSTQGFVHTSESFLTNPAVEIVLWMKGPSAKREQSWMVQFERGSSVNVEYQGTKVYTTYFAIDNGEMVIRTRDFEVASAVPHKTLKEGFEIRTRDFHMASK